MQVFKLYTREVHTHTHTHTLPLSLSIDRSLAQSQSHAAFTYSPKQYASQFYVGIFMPPPKSMQQFCFWFILMWQKLLIRRVGRARLLAVRLSVFFA